MGAFGCRAGFYHHPSSPLDPSVSEQRVPRLRRKDSRLLGNASRNTDGIEERSGNPLRTSGPDLSSATIARDRDRTGHTTWYTRTDGVRSSTPRLATEETSPLASGPQQDYEMGVSSPAGLESTPGAREMWSGLSEKTWGLLSSVSAVFRRTGLQRLSSQITSRVRPIAAANPRTGSEEPVSQVLSIREKGSALFRQLRNRSRCQRSRSSVSIPESTQTAVSDPEQSTDLPRDDSDAVASPLAATAGSTRSSMESQIPRVPSEATIQSEQADISACRWPTKLGLSVAATASTLAGAREFWRRS